MSWHLLIPIAEQLVKAGIDYMNSESVVQGAIAPTIGSDTGSVVLLTLRGDASSLRDKLRDAVNSIDGVEVVMLEVTNKTTESGDTNV